jgi:conjugative transfer signal peptidase TraF
MLERQDKGLREWAAALRGDRDRRRTLARRGLFVAAVCGAVLATVALPPAPMLVWNASASMPTGLYAVEPGARLATGDVAVARLPIGARALAARRHYLPLGVPLVKKVAAVAGQRICWTGGRVTIDGRLAALRRRDDRAGRPLPWRHGCTMLLGDRVLLLATRSPDSFDGRYFGPTDAHDQIGKGITLWTR